MTSRRGRIVILALLLLTLGGTQALAQGLPIYNNIPKPLPGNLVSVAFEATGTSEFGDRVHFAGTARSLTTVTVTMSSWGCGAGHWYSGDCVTATGATFSHPITLNIYKVGPGNAPGSVIGTITKTFAIPLRPSADNIHCTGANAGKWYSASENHCYNGKATNITFNLKSLHLVLPNEVIFGVAYNTSHYGYTPIGQGPACYTSSAGCGYDSLNVGVADPAVYNTVGSNPAPDDAYQYTISDSCSNGPIIPFGLDAGCWTGYKPAIRFNATRRDECNEKQNKTDRKRCEDNDDRDDNDGRDDKDGGRDDR